MAEATGRGGSSAAVAARVREGVPAGSLRHFAVLFSGSPDRPLLEALYALDAELRRIVQEKRLRRSGLLKPSGENENPEGIDLEAPLSEEVGEGPEDGQEGDAEDDKDTVEVKSA